MSIEDIKNNVARALEILDEVSDRIDRHTIVAQGMPFEELEEIEIAISSAWRELVIVRNMVE